MLLTAAPNRFASLCSPFSSPPLPSPLLSLPRGLSDTQVALQRRLINRVLLLNVLPLTFIGVVLSLNVFSAAALAALVPALGACLFGLCLAMLWMELAVSEVEHRSPVWHCGLLPYYWRRPLSSAHTPGDLH